MNKEQVPQLDALRGKVVEVYGSIDKFASAFGITRQQMCNKLNGKSGWSWADVLKAASLLGIGDNMAECHRVFF